MRTKILFLPLLIFTFIGFGLNSGGVVDKTQTAIAAPTQTPKPDLSADVQDVTLEKEKVYLWCPMPYISKDTLCPKDKQNVKVTTVTKDAEKDGLTYYYIVSGGQIIGQGANVVWDFSDAPPGNYTITVGVGGGYVIRGKTVTKTIKVEECSHCHVYCECPTLSILGPTESVKAGDSFIVTAKAQGGSQGRIMYQWKISGGTIIAGQKASQIIIKTTPDMSGRKIEATVEISGTDPACMCQTTVSETVSIK